MHWIADHFYAEIGSLADGAICSPAGDFEQLPDLLDSRISYDHICPPAGLRPACIDAVGRPVGTKVGYCLRHVKYVHVLSFST